MSDDSDNKSANWQERLSKARRLRGRSKAGQTKGTIFDDSTPATDTQTNVVADADLISVEDVLNTANLNDRMEMARARHAQILARRKANSGGRTTQEVQQKNREAFRFAQAKQPASDAEIPVMALPASARVKPEAPNPKAQIKPENPQSRPDILTPALQTPLSQSVAETDSEDQPEKKRRALGFVWAGLAVAAVLAIAMFDPVRNMLFPDSSTGELALSGDADRDAGQATEPIATAPRSNDGGIDQTDPLVFAGELGALRHRIDRAGFTNDIFVSTGFEAPARSNSSVVLAFDNVQDVVPSSQLGSPVPNYIVKSNTKHPETLISVSGVEALPDLERPGNWGRDIAAPIRPPQAAGFASIGGRPEVAPIAFAKYSALSLPDGSWPSPLARQSSPSGLHPLLLPEAPNRGFANIVSISTYTPEKFQFPARIENQQGSIVPPASTNLAISVSAPLPFESPVLGGQFNISNLAVHAPTGIKEASLKDILSGLTDNGFEAGSPRSFDFTIRKTNVRYFHATDAEAAKAVSNVVGGIARDFTSFKPRPPLGTLEVWLAGNAAPRPVARRSTGGSTAQNPALLDLRNRLIESLKAGDNL